MHILEIQKVGKKRFQFKSMLASRVLRASTCSISCCMLTHRHSESLSFLACIGMHNCDSSAVNTCASDHVAPTLLMTAVLVVSGRAMVASTLTSEGTIGLTKLFLQRFDA